MPLLTEVKLRAIKPTGKIERLYDSLGLYLEISKAGGKLWRWKYRFAGKEKRLAFGAWPEVSLREAREKRDEARTVLHKGIDPGAGNRKKVELAGVRTFEEVVREWIAGRLAVWSHRPLKPWLSDWLPMSIRISAQWILLRQTSGRA